MDECRALREWALSLPSERSQPASDNYIINRLAYVQAALPSRTVDEEAGEKRTAVYVSVLRGWGKRALEYMADRACRELKWFPTPSECLELLKQYREPPSERETVLITCDRYAGDALDRWIVNIRAGAPLGDVPEQWLRIGVEQGAVRRLDDGSFVSRALYAGPTMEKKYAQAA